MSNSILDIESPTTIATKNDGFYDKECCINSELTNSTLFSIPSGFWGSHPKLLRGGLCLGLVCAATMSGIDETIVATALSSISSEFKQSNELTWIASAYLLTSTAFQPLYGKLSDIFGRMTGIMIALLFFLSGSVGCGLATSPAILATCRGIAGIGAGGLISLGFIILADIVPVHQRSIYMSLINVTFGVSNVIGPLVGGLFVDHFGWRWVFYVNIPIGVITIVILMVTLPKSLPKVTQSSIQPISAKLKRVDFLGSFTLVVGIVLMVLALNWGGKEFDWDSWQVLSSLSLGALILFGFVLIETYVAREPILPWKVFNYNVLLASVATLVNGLIMFNFMYYWPLYHQAVHSSSATHAGTQVLPILLSDGLVSALSGLIIGRYGHYRWMMRLGMFMISLSLVLLGFLPDRLSNLQELVLPLIIGMGIGLNTQSNLTAIQAAVPDKDVAIVTSFSAFCLSMGGVLGLAIHGAIFDLSLRSQLSTHLPNFSTQELHHLTISVDHLLDLDFNIKLLAIDSYIETYQTLFQTLIPVALVGLIATLCLYHIPIPSLASSHEIKEQCLV